MESMLERTKRKEEERREALIRVKSRNDFIERLEKIVKINDDGINVLAYLFLAKEGVYIEDITLLEVNMNGNGIEKVLYRDNYFTEFVAEKNNNIVTITRID